MSELLNDLEGAFTYAANVDPLHILLSIVIVAVVQGLRSDGLIEVAARATHGLFWTGIAIFLVGGLMSADRFTGELWQNRLGNAWDALLALRFVEALGVWLLIFAVAMLTMLLRTMLTRR